MLAQVTNARSRFVRDGTELATAQPMKKCVIGLIRSGASYETAESNSIRRIKNELGMNVLYH
jgi:hypothetical protein